MWGDRLAPDRFMVHRSGSTNNGEEPRDMVGSGIIRRLSQGPQSVARGARHRLGSDAPAGGAAGLRDDIDDIDHAGKMRLSAAMAAGLQNSVNTRRTYIRHGFVGKTAGFLGLARARVDRLDQPLCL